MGVFGLLEMIAGVALVLWGFSYDISAPGTQSANLALLNERTLLVICGSALVVSGSVLLAIGEVAHDVATIAMRFERKRPKKTRAPMF